ncbi:50S ribosomal protein L18 [Gaopeijia maritima]|uniref:Large ribosomal subunit protein uL18 n=1 Tax=Gaopeijia maritima TaxID=3119007 RepID=A0ABU9E7I5_9BACT
MSVFAKQKKSRRTSRLRRHRSIRDKLAGTAARPRLVVYRSLKNIEGQVIDDDAGRTLVGLSTLHPDLRGFEAEGDNRKVEHAFAAGKMLAEKALQAGIDTVVFDRGGYKYHGRVKAFADGAREGGLKF